MGAGTSPCEQSNQTTRTHTPEKKKLTRFHREGDRHAEDQDDDEGQGRGKLLDETDLAWDDDRLLGGGIEVLDDLLGGGIEVLDDRLPGGGVEVLDVAAACIRHNFSMTT